MFSNYLVKKFKFEQSGRGRSEAGSSLLRAAGRGMLVLLLVITTSVFTACGSEANQNQGRASAKNRSSQSTQQVKRPVKKTKALKPPAAKTADQAPASAATF